MEHSELVDLSISQTSSYPGVFCITDGKGSGRIMITGSDHMRWDELEERGILHSVMCAILSHEHIHLVIEALEGRSATEMFENVGSQRGDSASWLDFSHGVYGLAL